MAILAEPQRHKKIPLFANCGRRHPVEKLGPQARESAKCRPLARPSLRISFPLRPRFEVKSNKQPNGPLFYKGRLRYWRLSQQPQKASLKSPPVAVNLRGKSFQRKPIMRYQ